MKKVLLIIIAIGLYAVAFSQTDISKKENQSSQGFKDLIQQIVNKVKNFQVNEANLADNVYNHSEKMEIYRNTLRLFIGEGEEYEEETPYGDVTKHDPVTIKIFPSKFSKRKKAYQVKNYLTRRINNSEDPNFRYKKVLIETSDVITIDNIEAKGDGKFVATAHYLKVEKNSATGEMNKITYEDRTSRTVKVYIESIQTYGVNGEIKTDYIVFLGDIDCNNVY